MTHVKKHFSELPPASLVRFEAPGTLNSGAELDILIVPAQSCRVRVVHEDAQSLTLCTLDGHPEAGRITFGAIVLFIGLLVALSVALPTFQPGDIIQVLGISSVAVGSGSGTSCRTSSPASCCS